MHTFVFFEKKNSRCNPNTAIALLSCTIHLGGLSLESAKGFDRWSNVGRSKQPQIDQSPDAGLNVTVEIDGSPIT